MAKSTIHFPSELEDLLPEFDAWVRGGRTPDDAAVSARKFNLSVEQCEMLRVEYLRRNQQFIDYKDPRVLRDNQRIESWYSGPDQEGAWCWPPYRDFLKDPANGWDREDYNALDRASTKILASLPHPGTQKFNHRGLVVGYVQSGKTANYSALICKAADVGYRLFIVLSGTTSSLRQQTQARMNADVVSHSQKNWSWLTYPEQDFSGTPSSADSVIDVHSHRRRIIAVVKKNVKILDSLIEWLGAISSDTRGACPAIVIDDEADNASVNTKDPNLNPSSINDRIRQLLGKLDKVAYVGYTATPFANLFINPAVPADLFPRHFIFDLERPRAYFGAERIFGRDLLSFEPSTDSFDGLDMIRDVSVQEPDEPGMLLPTRSSDRFDFEPATPATLREAISYFFLATAARYARGQSEDHSTMLVHTTMYVSLHDKMETLLKRELKSFVESYSRKQGQLEHLWRSEAARVVATNHTTDFMDVWRFLPKVIDRAEVVVDNGRPESSLRYDKAQPKVVIAVGGNTFSRGLTLHGLVVSYFIRRAAAYDTLLQMGRWFGYRSGYEDLPRIWMTQELQEQFFFLAGIEEEIRRDIRRLEEEQKTPLELAIRVRTHPRLAITSRNKMGKARLASASYSNRTLQSFLFNHENVEWLNDNLAAARHLGGQLRARAREVGEGKFVAHDVECSFVLEFLKAYSFHPDHTELMSSLIERYITRENLKDSLTRWNVAWLGQATSNTSLGVLDLGLSRELNCINRSRYRLTAPCNIKALISKADRTVDLRSVKTPLAEKELIDARNVNAPDVGLLMLYPISRFSVPEATKHTHLGFCQACKSEHHIPLEGAPMRHPLGAKNFIVGAALVFPESRWPESEYMANDLAELFSPPDVEDGELVPDDSSEVDK